MKLKNVDSMFKYFIIFYILTNIFCNNLLFCSINDAINQTRIDIGHQENQISPIYDKFGGLSVGGMDIDEMGDFYISDYGDSSIKKYNRTGNYIGKIKIGGVLFLNVICYGNKIYCMDRT